MSVRHRYPAGRLRAFAATLLEASGMPRERAAVVADVLLEGDLLGHTTHGLALLAPYLRELDAGRMERHGAPDVVADRGAALVWDGRRLPGPWLVREAIGTARERIAAHPVVSVAIRRSHHIGCLQAYLEPVASAGLVLLLTCSDPSIATVTPHGAVQPLYTPNPLAAAIPSAAGPVLMDFSASTTTNALTRRLHGRGERLPGAWLADAEGRPSDDPAVLFADPPGAILPLGGADLGHKGFALGLLVEALTSALAGHGRADAPKQWGASVFLQMIDPAGFGGRAAFLRETGFLVEACRKAKVPAGRPPVRVPGDGALARRARQLREGVELDGDALAALEPWAWRSGVALPEPAG
jgi:LDH2 family malate/lactate/ureidoglycolate dehydrogenase